METSAYFPASPSRSRRPESGASIYFKVASHSSNSSTSHVNHEYHSGRESDLLQHKGQLVRSTTGSLLQERLKEKKAARLSERRQSVSNDTTLDTRYIKSPSPMRKESVAGQSKDVKRLSSGGIGGSERQTFKNGMGVKEMEQAVSTLHKQNFDLKLELFHRRQKQTTLEERLEAAEKQITEQGEMQSINEQLLAELEKREQAIEEAVGIIARLEEEVEKLMQEREAVRSFDMQYESDSTRETEKNTSNGHQEPTSSAPQSKRAISSSSSTPGQAQTLSRRALRVPSFLSEKSEGAEVLRSLYLSNGHNHSRSTLSLARLADEESFNEPKSPESMESPRLSLLSESSFLSVYGKKNLAMEGLDLEEVTGVTPTPNRHRRSLSVEKWLDNRPGRIISSTPRAPSSGRTGKFSSINSVLESPLQRLEKLEQTLTRHNKDISSLKFDKTIDISERSSSTRNQKKDGKDSVRRTDVMTFDHQRGLPPTPDTVSTRTLQRYKDSSETLGRDVVRLSEYDRSLLNRSSTAPNLNTSQNRPRSACETVTSRRTEYNSDGESSDQYTDHSSKVDVEVASTSDPWFATAMENSRRMLPAPNMFIFDGGLDYDWGRDAMFNRSGGPRNLPHSRLGQLEPFSDKAASEFQHTQHEGTDLKGSDRAANALRMEPPQRRSSIAKASRRMSNAADTTAGAFPGLGPKDSKRSRITSKLFGLGRTDSHSSPGFQPVSGQPVSSPLQTESHNRPDQGYGPVYNPSLGNGAIRFEDPHGDSATPPPIARYPRAGTRNVGSRPISAGGYVLAGGGSSTEKQRVRRRSIIAAVAACGEVKNASGLKVKDVTANINAGVKDRYGMDGTGEEREGQVQGPSISPKKWFGIGKSRSLKP